nr:MAG TPA: hypothetical protein [Caudoviricetes sp.]
MSGAEPDRVAGSHEQTKSPFRNRASSDGRPFSWEKKGRDDRCRNGPGTNVRIPAATG